MRRAILVLLLAACGGEPPPVDAGPFVRVLGIAQDAGYPQADCRKECCAPAWAEPARRRSVASLAIGDGADRWIIDCTPDFKDQLRALDGTLRGVLLTHAHIGHYAGLVHLGREVMGAKSVPVHVMPRLDGFLRGNGPWSLLVKLNNIDLRPLRADEPVALNARIRVTPVVVPHRDEFSETVAFVVAGPRRRVLWLPDIDKWERWDRRIEDLIAQVDVAYLDGTFFDGAELPGRDMSEIPHPFIVESLARFAHLPAAERAKIRFVHLNHTNPALRPQSVAARRIRAAGLGLAREGERSDL